jgi:hypothetical protein
LPKVNRTDWPQRRIDWFILDRLEKAELTPSRRADARTLVRRAMFDLIGLPPTAEEVQSFIHDDSTGAY